MVICASILSGPMAFADENEVVALKNQINDLNKKLASIESKLLSVERTTEQLKPSIAHPGHAVVPPAEGPSGGLVHAMQDIQMGGYIETQFNANLSNTTANFSDPNHTFNGNVGGGNRLRIFDHNQNTFTLNAAKLWFAKEANPEGGAGFRLDLLMGEDAKLIENFSPGNVLTDNDFDSFAIEQGYVEAVLPLKIFEGNDILPDKVHFKAGRFVTLAGAEVIEGPNNWNISRSMMFGFAIPFIHTGIRSNFKLFKDYFDVYVGANNGWDVGVDNNKFKTMEFGLGFSPFEKVKNFSSIYWGPELYVDGAAPGGLGNFGQSGHKRFLITNVTTWDVTDKLSLMLDFNFGNQRRIPGLEGNAFENAQWWGIAPYVRYAFTEKFAMAYRFEYLNDNDTFRMGIPNKPFWGQTITAEYKMYDNLITRFEYRYDKADQFNAFTGSDSAQSTIGAQVIYLFQ